MIRSSCWLTLAFSVQTNVLAPLLMTLLLAPLLRKTPGKPKVIFTGSDVHYSADPTIIVSALSSNQSIWDAVNDEKQYVNEKRYFLSKVGPSSNASHS